MCNIFTMSPQHSYDSSHRIKHMFFSSTTFSGGRHIFGFFSHSCRVSGITWPTAIYLSIHPSIHPSIYLSISPVYLTVYLAIDPSTYQSINLSIYLSISLSLSLQDPPNRGVGGTRALAHSIWKNEIHVPNHQPVIYIYIYICIIIISFITVSWAITATFMYSTLPHVRKAPLSPLRHSLASCKPGRDQMVT